MQASTIASYAPNAEDIVLWRALGHRTPGHYIDVGACHPVVDSVTKLFSLRGWRGINIEPQPLLATMLRDDRPDDVNLAVGVGAESGELDLYVVENDQQRTTFSASLAAGYRQQGMNVVTQTVPVLTLDAILAEHPMPRIDFLKIDAEGFEDSVVAGIDLGRHRPTVILAEQGTHQHYDFPNMLESAGYMPCLFDGVNRFFVAEEAAEEIGDRLSYPACALDRWATAEVARLREHLQEMYESTTWKVGRAVLSPAFAVRRMTRRQRSK